MADFYNTPASKLGMTARELVLHRLSKLVEIKMNGGQVKDTVMLGAMLGAVS